MFDQLFSCPRAVQRYVSAPLLEPRLRYLQHRAAQGATSATLKTIAFYQRALSGSIDLEATRLVRPAQIEAAADHWISRTPASHAQTTGSASKVVFVSVARGWLGFLNRLEQVESAALPCSGLIADFRDYMRSERGLSPATVYTRCRRVEEFLGRYCADADALRQVTIVQIDAAIAEKGIRDRCTRASIRTYAYVLRSFFRYAEIRGWCGRGLAAGIVSPASRCRLDRPGLRCSDCAPALRVTHHRRSGIAPFFSCSSCMACGWRRCAGCASTTSIGTRRRFGLRGRSSSDESRSIRWPVSWGMPSCGI